MNKFMMGNSLWHLIKQSDIVCKGVLLVLLILSIISWALFLYKWILLTKKRRELLKVHHALASAQSIQDMLSIGFKYNDTLGGYVLNKNLQCYNGLSENAGVRHQSAFGEQERELLKENGYQIVDEVVEQEEANLPFLSATAAVSPLLGLFGTVWGLVHAFVSISEKQSADIATIAPGIAEALITTLAGLMIAIPALVMFVYLSTMVKGIEQRCMNIVDRFLMIVHRASLR